jgi:hypothetical protein
VVDERHWDGLPDGSGRATTDRVTDLDEAPLNPRPEPAHPLEALLTSSAASQVVVGRRALATYDRAAGLGSNGGAVS